MLESGYGTPMGHWDKVLGGLSSLAPVIAYDRPGIGESKSIDDRPTIENVSSRLVRMLEHLAIDPPYVLVGHSLGGLYVRGFAIHYPERLAGLVIIDPADFTETRRSKRAYYTDLGLSEEKIDSVISEFERRLEKRNATAPKPLREEGEVLAELRAADFEEIRNSPLPNVPIHILVGGKFDMPPKLRSREYDSEAYFRAKIRHRISRWIDVVQAVDKGMLLYSGDAGHFVHYDDPELLVSSVKIVLQDYAILKSERNEE